MDRDNSFQTYEKKRYAYLEVGNVGNSRLFREKGVMVLTRIAWAAITISLNKGYSYDLRLRTWHCSSTLPCLMGKGLPGTGEIVLAAYVKIPFPYI